MATSRTLARTLTHRDRLKPFLLDRLTDDAATRRSVGRRVDGASPSADGDGQQLSPLQYRQMVVRDITTLLNAHAPADDEELDKRWPAVAASVVNFGMPDLASFTMGSTSVEQLRRAIIRTLERFEPRLVPGTLAVQFLDVADGLLDEPTAGALPVEITGHLWALPVPEEFSFRTQIDCGVGRCEPKRDR